MTHTGGPAQAGPGSVGKGRSRSDGGSPGPCHSRPADGNVQSEPRTDRCAPYTRAGLGPPA